MLFALLAQAADTATPLGGWGSLVLQGGAFGLLTYIVAYLAPQLMKESRKEREARDQLFNTVMDALQTRFDDRNRAVVKEIVGAVKDQTQILATALRSSSERIEGAVSNACKANAQNRSCSDHQ